MTISGVGYLLIGLGLAIGIGGGGVPAFGFRATFSLYKEFKKMKVSGTEPPMEHKGAYYTVLNYKISAICILMGLLLVVIKYFI